MVKYIGAESISGKDERAYSILAKRVIGLLGIVENGWWTMVEELLYRGRSKRWRVEAREKRVRNCETEKAVESGENGKSGNGEREELSERSRVQ